MATHLIPVIPVIALVVGTSEKLSILRAVQLRVI